MVTSYYIMKLKAQKNLDLSEHLTHNIKSIPKTILNGSLCRVCLDKGSIALFDLESDTLDTIKQICNLQIDKNDNLPRCLCNVCYKFIKDAMLFINRAQETENLLSTALSVKLKHEEFPDYDSYEFIESDDKLLFKEAEDINMVTSPLTYITSEKKSNKKVPNLANRVKCKICNSVVTKSYFKRHITMHDPNHKRYACGTCGKSFRLTSAYYNHLSQHRNDFPHKCQLCPYKARDKALLRSHLNTHIGDYKYMCTECPTRYLFRSNLNRHMLKHKEKQFSCDTCNRMFHTKLAVQKHNEVDHLGIKNHLCNLCGKAFGYRKALMKHERSVHKREKLPYSRKPNYLQYENNN